MGGVRVCVVNARGRKGLTASKRWQAFGHGPLRATEEYQFDSTSDNSNGCNSTPIGQWRREIVRLRRKLAT